MTLGLVLSGGGVRGAAHVGVLKALHENNIRPQMIAGTSAGSIVAGLYACGFSPEDMLQVGKDITESNLLDIDYFTVFCSLINLFFKGNIIVDGLIRGDRIEHYLFKLTKGRKLRDAIIPTALTAVDINNARLVIFSSKPTSLMRLDNYIFLHRYSFAEAIRASIAVPGIFAPKKITNMRLVDGGLRANLPVEIIRRMGARKVIAVNLGYSGSPVPSIDDIAEITLQSIDIMIYQITLTSINQADIVIEPTIYNVKYKDFHKIDYIAECGYQATQQAMPQIKSIIRR